MKTFGLPRFARGRCQGEPLSPSGNVRIGDLMPMVPVNSVVGDFKDPASFIEGPDRAQINLLPSSIEDYIARLKLWCVVDAFEAFCF